MPTALFMQLKTQLLSAVRSSLLCSTMQNADLSAKPGDPNARYKFTTPAISADQRRSNFETWLFAKAFSDLLRGVRASLKQAYLAIHLISGLRVLSNATLQAVLAPIEERPPR
jgi:hypothetical protein